MGESLTIEIKNSNHKTQEEIEKEDKFVESQTKSYTIIEDIPFSFEKRDFTEITRHIQSNYDKDFDIACYDVEVHERTNTINNTPSGTITMNYLLNGFATEYGFKIYVQGGYVIQIEFNDSRPVQEAVKEYIPISESELKSLASENSYLAPYEKITEQKIQKKFDSEPYYQVKTIIYDNSMTFGRMEIFIYRLSEMNNIP